jgi:hypothetical protein
MGEDADKKRSTAKGTGAAVGTTGIATAIVWLLGRFHVSLSAEEGALIAGGLTTVGLFVWHYGIRNIVEHLWRGPKPAALAR